MKYATTLVLSMALAVLAFGQTEKVQPLPTLEDLDKEVKAAVSEVAQKRTDLKEAQTKADMARATKRKTERELTKAEKSRDDMQQELETVKDDIVSLRSKKSDLANSLKDDPNNKKLEAEHDEAAVTLTAAEMRIQTLEDKLSKENQPLIKSLEKAIDDADKVIAAEPRAEAALQRAFAELASKEQIFSTRAQAEKMAKEQKPATVTPSGLTNQDKTALAELFKTEADKVANPLKEELKRNTAALAKLESETTTALNKVDESLRGLTTAVKLLNEGDKGLKGLNEKFAKLDAKVDGLGTKTDLTNAANTAADRVIGKVGDKIDGAQTKVVDTVNSGNNTIVGKLGPIGTDATTAATKSTEASSKAGYAGTKAEEAATGVERIMEAVNSGKEAIVDKVNEVGGKIIDKLPKPEATRALPAPAPMPAPVVLYPRWVDEYEAKGGGYAIQGRLPDGYQLATPFQYRSGPNCRTQYLYVPPGR